MHIINVTLELKAVTCPGVWLCPKGNVLLKSDSLDSTKKTRRIYPKFPLQCNETINFQKAIIGGDRAVIQVLQSGCLNIELIQFTTIYSQFGIVLARFSQNLYQLFQPFTLHNSLLIRTDVQLLTSRTNYFPGIISPKINAKLELRIDPYTSQMEIYSSFSPNLVSHCLNRQHPVCHRNSKCKQYYSDTVFNEKCSVCSLSPAGFTLEETPYYEDLFRNRDQKLVSCHWCDEDSSCQCCTCWEYHLQFH